MKPELKSTEWDLLDALWTLERASAREVADHLEARRGWAYSTVKTLLDRLVERELVHARKVGNVWEYSAAIDRATARRSAWSRFVEIAFGGAAAHALEFAAGATDLTETQRRSLQALIDEHERGEE